MQRIPRCVFLLTVVFVLIYVIPPTFPNPLEPFLSSLLLVVVSLLNLSLWAYCVTASLASVITRESDLDWAADAVDQLTNQRGYTSFPLSLCFPFFLPRNTQWMATPRRRQSKKKDAQQVFTI